MRTYDTPTFYNRHFPISLDEYDPFNSAVGTRPLETARGNVCDNYQELFDLRTNKTLSVVSNTYTPINNAWLYGHIETALSKAYTGPVKKIDHVYGGEGMHKGVRTARRYVLSDLKYDVAQGTRNTTCPTTITPEIWAFNSYDGTQRARASFSLFDIACANGLATKDMVNFINVRHTKNASAYFSPEIIEQGLDVAKRQIDLIRSWANTEIDYATAKDLLLALKGMNENKPKAFPVGRKPRETSFDRVWDSVGSEAHNRGGMTVWAIVSAATNYSTLRQAGGGMHTASLDVGVDRQESVANWITNVVTPQYNQHNHATA